MSPTRRLRPSPRLRHAVNGEEEDTVAGLLHQADKPLGFLDGENVGQTLASRGLDDVHPLPCLMEGMLPEEPKAETIDLDRTPGKRFQEFGEIGLKVLRSQIGGTPAKVIGQAPDRPAVQVDGGRPLSLKLQCPEMVLVERFKLPLLFGIHEIPPRENFPGQLECSGYKEVDYLMGGNRAQANRRRPSKL